MWMLLFLACGTPKAPQSVADCDALSTGKDDCYAKMAPAVFAKSPEEGIKLVEEKITDPTIRDFVYLTVTRDQDPSSTRYCDRMKDEVLANRCKTLVARPHLHRGTGEGQPGAPGGPPPGSPPPGTRPPDGPPPGSPPSPPSEKPPSTP